MRTAPFPCRRRRRLRHGALAAATWVVLAMGGTHALPQEAAAEPVRLAQASGTVSLAEAMRIVKEQTGGQVLRAETKRDKGRAVHRIRVLTDDGRVRTWHVDAETGRIY
jgi:uncharacterized membrane protein YkoI